MKESKFQSDLKEELYNLFPGCFITKLDSGHIQGIPDLLVLYKNMWCILECKKAWNAQRQPNQEDYVNILNSMSFSRFIYPENKNEVLKDLYAFFTGGSL